MSPSSAQSGATRPGAYALPPPETVAERRTRQLAMLRRLADLNMQVAEIAGEQVRENQPETPDGISPALTLARATRAVTHVIALENRVVAGEKLSLADPANANNADPRRLPLRQLLHRSLGREPDRAARALLRRQIDDRIDEELATDPSLETTLGDVVMTVSDDLGLNLDCSQMPDDFLVPFISRPHGANDKPVRLVLQPDGPEPPNILT